MARWRGTAVWRLGIFAISGGIGFVVDAGLLQLLAGVFGLEVHLARVFSFLTALTTTWQINRRFTFQRAKNESLLHEWLRYFVSSLLGGLTNYGAFALSIATSPWLRTHLYLAVAIGSVAGMFVNYALYSRFVFRQRAT